MATLDMDVCVNSGSELHLQSYQIIGIKRELEMLMKLFRAASWQANQAKEVTGTQFR